MRTKTERKAERLADSNHTLIEQQVNDLKERVLSVFSGDIQVFERRMIDASIDVGAVHLLRLSSGPPTPYVMWRERGPLHTRTLLTTETARSGIQLLAWMRLVGSEMFDFATVSLNLFSFATDVDDDLNEPLEAIRDKHQLMEAHRGEKETEGSTAFVAMYNTFWQAYQKYVMEIEPADWDLAANETISWTMTMLRRDTNSYYCAMQSGPPITRAMEATLDYFERYQLWKKHESDEPE